jgi:peptidyl-tRNA hydrolase
MSRYKFYVIVRRDLETMTPGRVAAQVSHATSMLHENIKCCDPSYDEFDAMQAWMEDREFGTTIVLEFNQEIYFEFDKLVAEFINSKLSAGDGVVISGAVHDPTYAVPDGMVTHYIPLYTCVWALVDTQKCPVEKPFPNFNTYKG